MPFLFIEDNGKPQRTEDSTEKVFDFYEEMRRKNRLKDVTEQSESNPGRSLGETTT